MGEDPSAERVAGGSVAVSGGGTSPVAPASEDLRALPVLPPAPSAVRASRSGAGDPAWQRGRVRPRLRAELERRHGLERHSGSGEERGAAPLDRAAGAL